MGGVWRFRAPRNGAKCLARLRQFRANHDGLRIQQLGSAGQ